MRVYLDNAATTAVRAEVIDAMLPYMGVKFGNASSLHAPGRDAREALEAARASLAKRLGADPREVIFTSGGTEGNNMALKGIASEHPKGGHIITSKIEHSSILNPLKWLEGRGYEVTYLDVDGFGIVDPKKVDEAVRKDTILITIGHGNNEIGTLQDVEAISKVANEHTVPFHTDACQSFTKTSLDAGRMNLDMVTVNAHKINGPKGIGALVVRKGAKIAPLLHGGEQERRLRPGTENVGSAVGFAKAAELVTPKEVEHMRVLRDMLIKGVLDGVEGVRLNGHPGKRLANNANFTFAGIEGEALLLRLDMKGVYCSSGSACSSQSLEPSHVILALGSRVEESHGSLRATVGWENTAEEVDYAVGVIKAEVGSLRRISPMGR